MDSILIEVQPANRFLVPAASLLHHRNRLLDFSPVFVIPVEDDAVGQVARIDWARGVGSNHHSVLSYHHESGYPPAAEKRKQFMKLGGKEWLVGHCVQVPIQAVDHDDLRMVLLD